MVQQFCHICKSNKAVTKATDALNTDFICTCPTCGVYHASEVVLGAIEGAIPSTTPRAAVLSYYVRRMQHANGFVRITEDLLREFLKRSLPTAAEQVDNLIMLAGERSVPGETLKLTLDENFSLVGAHFEYGLSYLIRILKGIGLLENTSGVDNVCLSLEGWKK